MTFNKCSRASCSRQRRARPTSPASASTHFWTRLDLGAALAESDRARSKKILENVAQVADELGARPTAELAEKRLRALGVRTSRRGAIGAGC